MAELSDQAVLAELETLRARINELESAAETSHKRRRAAGRRRRVALVIGVAGVVAAATTGVAMASGTSNTGLSYIALSPSPVVANGLVIATGGTASVVVSGGTTTVPTDATAVRLKVTATGPSSGAINAYPAGNSADSSGQQVKWSANKSDGGSLDENIGTSNEVTFRNTSKGSATITVSVTGYSTQVSASDLNDVGGTAGQVLTNTGTGASWQNVNTTSTPLSYITTGETEQELDETELWTESISVPALTQSLLDNSSVSVYMYFGGNEVPLPYSSAAGNVFTTVSYQLSAGQILITRSTSDNSGSIELPGSLQFRYVITTATGPSAGTAIVSPMLKANLKARSTK